MKKRTPWLVLIGLVILIVIVIGCNARKKENMDEQSETEVPAEEALPDYVGLGTDVKEARIRIVGVQNDTDNNGMKAAVLFFDVTNTSDYISSPSLMLSGLLKALQNNFQLERTKKKTAACYYTTAYDDYERSIYPGITVRCAVLFAYDNPDAPITFSLGDDLSFQVRKTDMIKKEIEMLPYQPVSVPYYAGHYTSEVKVGDGDTSVRRSVCNIRLDRAELVTGYTDSSNGKLRIYYEITNLDDEAKYRSDFKYRIRAFQNGIELEDVMLLSDKRIEEDDNRFTVEAGESLMRSICYNLHADSESPVEVVVYDLPDSSFSSENKKAAILYDITELESEE